MPLNPWLISPPDAALRLHDPACLIIDARPAAEYAAGHLAGAAGLDVMASPCKDTAPAPLAAYVEHVTGLLQGLGLEPDHQVIVYDNFSGNQAARAFRLLQWLGHPSVQILDGGLGAWRAAGLSLTTAIPTRGRGHFVPTGTPVAT